MTRRPLPVRRRSLTLDLRHGDADYSVSVGLYDDGHSGEIFLAGGKSGSDMGGLLADLGVLLSRSLQYGDTVEALAAGIGRLGGEAPASLIGVVLDRLATK